MDADEETDPVGLEYEFDAEEEGLEYELDEEEDPEGLEYELDAEDPDATDGLE